MKDFAPAPRALIVDDDQNVLQLLSIMLKRLGFETVLARSGESALSCFSERSVELVVTDFSMPHMNGLELAVAIRERDGRVPILMVTALAEQFRMQPPLPAVDAILSKPVGLREFSAVIDRLVGQRT